MCSKSSRWTFSVPSQMISLWSNIAVKCMYNFAKSLLKNVCGWKRKGDGKFSKGFCCWYFSCTWFHCFMQNFCWCRKSLFRLLAQTLSTSNEVYRNDILTFHRKELFLTFWFFMLPKTHPNVKAFVVLFALVSWGAVPNLSSSSILRRFFSLRVKEFESESLLSFFFRSRTI